MSQGPIVALGPDGLVQLLELLGANALPGDDCAAQVTIFRGIYDGQLLIAAGGIEPAGEHGLLRSLVVSEARRGEGLAARLTRQLIAEAREAGVDTLWLLTETADDYFARFGFRRSPRDEAPPAIARTRQFTTLCPDSAVCMKLPLQ